MARADDRDERAEDPRRGEQEWREGGHSKNLDARTTKGAPRGAPFAFTRSQRDAPPLPEPLPLAPEPPVLPDDPVSLGEPDIPLRPPWPL